MTFGGIHSTNGVQLLWFWVVYLLALTATSKAACLATVLGVCFVLSVLCYVPI